jgi:hypothetical protein
MKYLNWIRFVCYAALGSVLASAHIYWDANWQFYVILLLVGTIDLCTFIMSSIDKQSVK